MIYATCQARLQLANPYVKDGAELDRQVATLAGADGRSRGDEGRVDLVPKLSRYSWG